MLRPPNTQLVTALGCNGGHMLSFHLASGGTFAVNIISNQYISAKKVVLTNHYFAVEKYHHSEKFPHQLLSKHG